MGQRDSRACRLLDRSTRLVTREVVDNGELAEK